RIDVPQRIITIAPNAAETICALGACDRIIGVSKFCVYPPELGNRPLVGGLFDPDLEKIIALRPDLVVLRGRSESLQRMCRDRGIAVYEDKTDTFDGVGRCAGELGERLGLTSEARRVVRGFRERLAAIRQRTRGLPRPRVFLTVARRPDRLAGLLTTGRGTFLDEMIDLAGGVNAFGRLDMRYPQVSTEGILAARPDVIIELMPEVTLTPALRRRMLDQWKSLSTLPAVAGGRIHFLTDDHCLIPSLRYVEIVEKVSRLLHPAAAAAADRRSPR
ncbi:MAG: ABC transporter substrate-binding protein, partial [Phycisphaerae bacterium]